jgi:hypothetical protein
MIARKEQRKRTKTRSKQKNIRRDNRPAEKRPGGDSYAGPALVRDLSDATRVKKGLPPVEKPAEEEVPADD